MTGDLKVLSLSQYSLIIARRRQKKLLPGFWLMTFALFIYELFFTNTESLTTNCAAILITASALLPAYLWCSGSAVGIPIFPLFGLTFLWTYALPLVSNHPQILQYSPTSHLFAGLTVTGFLCLGTFIWFQFVRTAPPTPKSYLALNTAQGDSFFLFVVIVNIIFNTSITSGWLSLDSGTFSIIRGLILGLFALSVFSLAYRIGTQELSKQQTLLFLLLFVVSMIVNAAGLLLISAASQFLVAVFAFTIGRKKLPLLPVIIVLVCLSLLHYGKSDMRAKYWFGAERVQVQPWDYPAWYGEWLGYTWKYLSKNESNSSFNTEEKASLAQRSSVIQLLLLAQSQSPQQKPYLNGTTYAILPQLLVPRIFNSNKIASHEGTYLLNIYYGRQTREDTYKTTIGWGLLAESYANFGLIGCAGLAVVLGSLYGQTTRWSNEMPVLSVNYLFAILVMSYSFQTEFSAGVYVAALFQSSFALGGIVIFLMKPHKISQG